ncbi:MAG: pentapeptide repeat-containing protein [Cyanobacteria bacterium SID2]|nr:pentapeptide repeat-containing protein [Cyanobacteria bacterium SID2]MBP0004371.1 pentapeptide repeat-containing protein [Cyanobacteria bacterium SBC]
MANAEHLWILERGVDVWNRWREENDRIVPNLHDADLRGFRLAGVNFRRACLSEASLSLADLRDADLREADLYEADLFETRLHGAKLDRAYLFRSNCYRAELLDTSLHCAMLGRADLTRASLRGANLTQASLGEANLTKTDLTNANLSEAFLKAARVCGTVFDNAVLTGACVEDWETDRLTRLEEAICEFVFFEYDVRSHLFRRRYPRQPGQTLAAGAFATLFKDKPQQLELSFSDGISWKAVLGAFETLDRSHPENALQLCSIEQLELGKIVLSLSVSATSDILEIERSFRQEYDRVRKASASTNNARARTQLVTTPHNGSIDDLLAIVRVLATTE